MSQPADVTRSQEYQARNALHAERAIKASLQVLNLPIRGSYTSTEVRSILGIAEATYWRLVKKFELDENGRLVRPDCLRTFSTGNHRRVPFLELVEFVRRNDGYLLDHT
jgi:hypothetical protein